MSTEHGTVVYGGTFDPFGNHHVKVIEFLLERFEEVLVPLSVSHALKGTEVLPFEHRFNMLALGIEECFPSENVPPGITGGRVQPVLIEMIVMRGRSTPVYAYHMLQELAKMPGRRTLQLAIGPDIPDELHKWSYVEEIKRDFGFYEVPDFDQVHSTDIRERVRKDELGWDSYVPRSVAKYIRLHQLYGTSGE